MADTSFLALDCGTHALRALLVDARGRPLLAASRPLALDRAGPGLAEQDPLTLLEAARVVLAEVLAAAPSPPWALGIAVQRSSVVCWNREDLAPLSPVLSWQDTRAAKALARLAPRGKEIARRTGLRLSPHYGASKLAWCLAELPAAAAAARAGTLAMGPLAAWLLAGLAKGAPCAVDEANASRTLLWNLDTRDWDPELLALFGLPAAALPTCRPIRFAHGWLDAGGMPITALTGDQNAALFADGPLAEGTALVNLGTGAFVLRPSATLPARREGLLRGVADSSAGGARYLEEGTVNGAGAALTWAETTWGLAPIAPRLDALLPAVAEPALILNAVGGLGSPWWRHDLVTRPREPARWLEGERPRDAAAADALAAGMAESLLFLLRCNLDRLREAGPPLARLKLSGGLARSSALCARLAALAGLPVEIAEEREATARGAAYLAGGCPQDWEPSPLRRLEPVADPALERRYESWLAMMHELS